MHRERNEFWWTLLVALLFGATWTACKRYAARRAYTGRRAVRAVPRPARAAAHEPGRPCLVEVARSWWAYDAAVTT